jgi:hypothetical protein
MQAQPVWMPVERSSAQLLAAESLLLEPQVPQPVQRQALVAQAPQFSELAELRQAQASAREVSALRARPVQPPRGQLPQGQASAGAGARPLRPLPWRLYLVSRRLLHPPPLALVPEYFCGLFLQHLLEWSWSASSSR